MPQMVHVQRTKYVARSPLTVQLLRFRDASCILVMSSTVRSKQCVSETRTALDGEVSGDGSLQNDTEESDEKFRHGSLTL